MTSRARRKTVDARQASLFADGADAAAGAAAPDRARGGVPPAAAALAQTLADWAERGWLRRLDAALARFVLELDPALPAPALLAIALAAHMEGHGHACLAIDELVQAPEALLGWKPEPLAALQELLHALPAEPERWIDACRGSRVVAPEAPAADDARPLVLSRGRLYLRRYWDYERRVARQVRARAAAVVEPVDAAEARRWLDRLFPETSPTSSPNWQKVACAVALGGRFTIVTGGPGTGKTYTAARLLALLFAMAPAPERLRVALAAPTGKAAARLKQSIDSAMGELQRRLGDALPVEALARRLGAATTLHSLLGARPDTRRFGHDAAHPLEVDVLVVDEASMVHLEMMAALVEALPAGARLVLLGDKDQLASVEAGAVLGELCRGAERGGYTAATIARVLATTGEAIPAGLADALGKALAQRIVMLRESQRFGGAIGAFAQAVNAGDAAAAAALLDGDRPGPASVAGVDAGAATTPRAALPADDPAGAVRRLAPATPASIVALAAPAGAGARGGYRDYLEAIRGRPVGASGAGAVEAWAKRVLDAFDGFRVLCAVRDGDWGVDGLNRAIERRLVETGLLPSAGEWYEGRPVIVTRNDRGVGVYNGDIGIVLRPAAGEPALRAYFLDGAAVRSVGVSRLSDVETAFAMTVHKAQGSEFAHAVLVLPAEPGGVATRELVYTGITRARATFTLAARTASALTDAVATTARRTSGLHDLLDDAPNPKEPNG